MAKASAIPGLEAEGRFIPGAHSILSARLAEMCDFRLAALDATDPSGVHDMRVAARRLRSALRDFLPFLPRSRKLRSWDKEVHALADLLGRVRDQDVARATLAQVAREAPDEAAGDGIATFEAEREVLRAQAQAELTATLTEERLAQLPAHFVEAWAAVLRSPRATDDSGLTLREAGRRIIADGWQRVARLSQHLYRPHRVRQLHKLRLAAKRLRYSLRLFVPCWPPETLKPLSQEVARLQSALGDMHDCDLWLEELGRRLDASDETTLTPERHAAFWLMRHFAKERTRHYREALACRHDWESQGLPQKLAEMIEDRSAEITPGLSETQTPLAPEP